MKTFYQYGDPMRLSFSTKNNEQRTGEFYRDSEGLLLKQHELNQWLTSEVIISLV